MCGGQSKRMGTDKGLILIQNTYWSAYMASKLKALNVFVSISINLTQVKKYQSVFTKDTLIVDNQDIMGPLNGLLSAHQKYPDDDLLLLACDMINMQTKTLEHLIEAYSSDTHQYDYYVYQNQHFAEPFCGIYTSNALKNMMLKGDLQLSGLSLQKVLNYGDTHRLKINEISSFDNYNQINFDQPA